MHFITGAAGFIGSNLAKRLLKEVEGVKVVGLDNMSAYYDVSLKEARLAELNQYEQFYFIKGNLADGAAVDSIFGQYQPQIVVNLGEHRRGYPLFHYESGCLYRSKSDWLLSYPGGLQTFL